MKRPGKEQAEGHQEGWEDFSLKIEWFKRYRDPGVARTLKEVYDAALDQARRMAAHVHERPPMPEKPLKRPVLGLHEEVKASVKVTANPNAAGAIGFASSAVEITGRGDLTQSVLYLPLDPALSKRVDGNTICIFRYAPRSGAWTKMPVCGLTDDGTTAWARVHEPGVYIAIGLPDDPAQQASLLLLYLHRGKLPASMKKTERAVAAREALKGGGKLAAVLAGVTEDREERFEPDAKRRTSRSPRGASALGGVAGLPDDLPLPGKLPSGGFAEWDILEDICPPWFGKRGIPGHWPKVPIRWPVLPPPWPILPIPCFWRAIGPKNINGRIGSLCNHPTDSNIIYAGAANGGVWKTTNAGETWSFRWMTEESMAVGSIALCRDQPEILYAATGEDSPGWGPSYPGVGVYKSIDSGGTWTKCPGGGVGDRCMKILVHPTNPTIVYVASNTGLFKTTDGGATPWTLVHTGHCSDAVMDPGNPQIVYVAIWNDGIYKTTDGGTSWSAANGSYVIKWTPSGPLLVWRGIPTGSNAQWIALAIGHHGAGGTSFLVAKLGLDSGSVYRTTNGGETWTKIAGPVQAVSYNEWTNLVAVNPSNHSIIFAGGVGMSRTTNGSTFNSTSGTHSDHQQLIFDPNDSNTCYVATDGGVYKSTDGGQSWILKSQNLQATQLVSFGVGQSGGFLAGGATQDQGIIQTTGSTDWINSGGGNEWGIFEVDPNDSQNVYISPGGSARLRQSTNGGTSWTTLTSGLTDTVGGTTTSAARTIHIGVKPGNSSVLVFAGRISDDSLTPTYTATKLWRSTNKGASFSAVLTMTDSPTRVAFAPSNGNICFVSCTNGKIFKSSSSGSSGSWAEPYTALNKPVSAYITCVTVGWNDPDLVLIGYGGFSATRIMRSTDGGATWTNISGATPATALPLIPINDIATDQYDSNVIYAGTDLGVYRTTDGGVSWSSFNEGILCDHPRIIVTGLYLKRSNNALYSGTMGRGAYRRYL